MTLRRVLSAAFTTLVSLAVATALALIITTNLFDRSAQALTDALEAVRLGQGIEIALLTYDREPDDFDRALTEAELREMLADARAHVSSRQAADLLAETGRRVDVYVAAASAPASAPALFDRAVEGVRDLVQLNLARSADERSSAASWHQSANTFATVIVALSSLALGAVLLWLRATTFGPAARIAAVVQRLADGEKSARAAEAGAAELRTIARQVNKMADALARQEKNRLAFLAGVAHDLRNPLSALKLAVGIVGPGQPLPPEPRVRQTLARVQRQVDRLERMVWDFLDAARIEAGVLDLRLARCDLRELADAVVDLFRSGAPTHELVLSLPSAPAVSRCDPNRVEQVLTNLVSNAIKYSPRGGRVELRISRQSGQVHVAVSDEGVGIASEELTRLFEPFRRSGASTESIPGVGLGLFVSRRIIEAHGGTIAVESAPQRGSTFHVFLPGENGSENEGNGDGHDGRPH